MTERERGRVYYVMRVSSPLSNACLIYRMAESKRPWADLPMLASPVLAAAAAAAVAVDPGDIFIRLRTALRSVRTSMLATECSSLSPAMLDDVRKACDRILKGREAKRLPENAPELADWMTYWMNAPLTHFVIPPENAHRPSRSGPLTLSEMVWITRAYVDPVRVNEGVVTDMLLNPSIDQIRAFQTRWPINSSPIDSSYLIIRSRFFAATVYLATMEAKTLLRLNKLGACKEDDLGYSRPIPHMKMSAGGVATSSSAYAAEMKLVEEITAESKVNEELQRNNRAFGRAQESQEAWGKECASTFWYTDAYYYLTQRYPIRTIPDEHREGKVGATMKDELTKWFAVKTKFVLGDQFLRPAMELTVKMALPLGAMMRDQRINPTGPDAVYLRVFGEEEATKRMKFILSGPQKIFENKELARDSKLLHVRDGILISVFNYNFMGRLSRHHFIDRYFITCQDLRGSMKKIHLTRVGKEKRSPLVVQFNQNYYIHWDGYFYRTQGAEDALWYWMYIVKTECAGLLDGGADINARWLAQFEEGGED